MDLPGVAKKASIKKNKSKNLKAKNALYMIMLRIYCSLKYIQNFPSKQAIFSIRLWRYLEKCFNTLSNSDHVFFDSTLKAIPSLFYQIFVIYAITRSTIVLYVYAPMSNKSTEF
ncbi:hypothetical protein HZS_626 [Henneguya salminicola]|nr:hypothetical protein HZS_626 [Henneguya salminicola]